MDLDEAFKKAVLGMDEQRGNYFYEPIPMPLDGVLYDFIVAFAEAAVRSQRRLVERLTRRQLHLIGSLGVRLASMAARDHDPELVVVGLVALWLEWPAVDDYGEHLMDLAPMYQAAMKLEASPAELFDRAATIVHDEEFRDLLRAFNSRSEQDKSLQAMGWREMMGSDGFRYVPRGWKV